MKVLSDLVFNFYNFFYPVQNNRHIFMKPDQMIRIEMSSSKVIVPRINNDIVWKLYNVFFSVNNLIMKKNISWNNITSTYIKMGSR